MFSCLHLGLGAAVSFICPDFMFAGLRLVGLRFMLFIVLVCVDCYLSGFIIAVKLLRADGG